MVHSQKPPSARLTGPRAFYTMVITQTLSMLGSRMTGFAIGVWLFIETGDTTPLLLVGVFTWLPKMFLGSLAGVIADQFNRRRLIVMADAAQAIPTFILMLLFATDTFQIWHVYAAALVQGFFGMIQGPAFAASITMLIPDAQRDRANALSMVAGPVAQMLAPVIGGLLYALIGVTGVILIDLLTFIVAASVIGFLIHIPQPVQKAQEAVAETRWQKITAGFRFLWQKNNRPILFLSAYFLYLNFVTEGVWKLLSPYLLIKTGYNEELVGLILGISSAGLVIGGIIPIVWKPPMGRIPSMLIGLGAGAICLMAFAVMPSLPLIAVTMFVMMLPYKFANTMVSSVQQAKIPPELQGRVFALIGQIALFAIPTSLLVTGPLVDRVLEPAAAQPGDGIALYIFGSGALLLLGTLITWSIPSVRHIETRLPDYNIDGVLDSETEVELDAKPVRSPQSLSPTQSTGD